MYKTVRHGENSLQYTILPQEEGVVNVKPRKAKKKGKTAAILTVTVILICGIIATAVLVPLLLTSDLVVLPASFQKFSVSSLHKTHSGNHVVVVAKKPHGWVNHHNPAHPPAFNKTYYVNNIYKSQDEIVRIPQNSTTTQQTTTISSIKMIHTTEKTTTSMSNEIEQNKINDKKEDNVLKSYHENKYTEVPIGKNYLDISTTTRSSKGNQFSSDGVVRLLNTEIHTTTTPWYQQKWSLGDTVSYVRWSGNNMADNLMALMAGSGIVLLCFIIIFIVWIKRRKNLNNDKIKDSADPKSDDKDTLLKESTAGSEED